MKRTLLSFTILLITLLSYAQVNSSIDLTVGSGYSFRALSNTSNSDVDAQLFQNRIQNEESKQNWNVTISYNQTISKNLFFKTGLKYSSYTYYKLKITDLLWPSQHDGMGGFDPSGPLESTELHYFDSHKFIGVPLYIRYQLNSKKLHPFVELGSSFNYYLTTTKTREIKAFEEQNSSQSNRLEDYTALNLFGHMSLGINYSCFKNIQLYGQISYSRQLNSLSNIPFQEYLYDYGIQLGVRKVIRKEESVN